MDNVVAAVLQQASSQDPNVLKPAENTLKQWETQRGFYTTLYNIFSNHSLAVNIRWMAVLCFKNGVDRYWRRNAPYAIAEDEKESLRQRIISSFDEPVNQLAVQLAVLIAKIARYDCPREWDTLIPTLLEVIRGQNTLAQHRALLTMHHVVKTLASKRLPGDVRLFHELTASVITFILNTWNTYTESFLIMASNEVDSSQIQDPLEKALLLLKILRRLIVYGFSKPSQSQDATLFLEVALGRARTCLEWRKMLASRGIHMEVCDKFIIHLTKMLVDVLETHPLCYIELIPKFLEFSFFYCFTEAGRALAFERFIIQCLNMMKIIVISVGYKPETAEREIKDPLMWRAYELKREFFTPETLTEICLGLVTHYFLLTPADLESWDTEPENFAVENVGESWKYSLRACTQFVFVAIFHQFRGDFASVLVELIETHHRPVEPDNLHAVLLKDAVYNAVGLAAFDLYDEVDFDIWFLTTLRDELKVKSNNYRIIRRRVCWLIGRWTSIKLSSEFRPELYKLMVEALSPEEDLGVRLAASGALKVAIDDFQFNTEDFSPFLEPAFSLLFALLKEVDECDTKMHVLFVLSFVIERVGSDIKPYVGALNSHLPALWQQSEDHNMLRCAIVTTLVQLAKAFGPESVILQPLVVGVVSVSCDVNQEGHVYLVEDGLDLWLALLENAPAPTPEIMDLLRNMPSLLESSTAILRPCLHILQAYVLLSPEEFVCHRGPVIIETLRSLLADLSVQDFNVATKFFETILSASPIQGVELIKPLLVKIFQIVLKGEKYPMIMNICFCIIGRVLFHCRDVFSQVISGLGRNIGGINEEAVLGQLVHLWNDHMPLVSQPQRRKLLTIALCCFLEGNSLPSVCQHFPRIISNIIETLNDITILDDTGRLTDSYLMIISEPRSIQMDYKNENERRRRELERNDPLYNVSLIETLNSQYVTLRRTLSNEQFERLFNTLGPSVREEMNLSLGVENISL